MAEIWRTAAGQTSLNEGPLTRSERPKADGRLSTHLTKVQLCRIRPFHMRERAPPGSRATADAFKKTLIPNMRHYPTEKNVRADVDTISVSSCSRREFTCYQANVSPS